MTAIARLAPDADIVFVHRDANGGDPERKFQEIAAGVREVGIPINWVGVVPIRETEAWCLVDEAEIRLAADNPDGRMPLDLPKMGALERLAGPKKRLEQALATASGLSGQRLRDFKKSFGSRRALLLERLAVDGPVQSLSSWIRLQQDLRRAIEQVSE